MSVIQTCGCEECDMQKTIANHWVMLYEKNGNLVILPKWDDKMIHRTRHFCGRAHASRYVERWMAGPVVVIVPVSPSAKPAAPASSTVSFPAATSGLEPKKKKQ